MVPKIVWAFSLGNRDGDLIVSVIRGHFVVQTWLSQITI